MIDFRYHLVSIIAVFLALAVGIALGGALLHGALPTTQNDSGERGAETERLRAEKDVAERLSSGGDRLVDAYADRILRDRLDGVGVAVVEAPGADPRLREGIAERIRQAGGTVTARPALTDTYLDPGEAAFVRELTDQLATGIGLPRGSAHDRAGTLLGRALLRSDGKDSDDGDSGFDSAAALAGFAEAGMLGLDGEPGDAAGAADAVVVLAPAEPLAADAEAYAAVQRSGGEEPTGSRIMLDTANALEGVSEAAVLVGGPSAARPGGLVHQARAEGAAYSTVDAAGSDAGDVAAALVVAAAAEGGEGAYGVAEGTDAFMPAPLPGAEDGADGADDTADDDEAK
ncbi:hypothetical protein LP52_07155 [Streptomonospora alba]|uniref:Copper transporter n=1 Tax=Streptomonospora alba TaxID=183763 RepID=A0A0C2JKF6_9ACTN|nr:copper transporter [Streptomonospora alba]KIH99425.1 hypothetical protein LP52_07155 [Streptomonospora alba]